MQGMKKKMPLFKFNKNKKASLKLKSSSMGSVYRDYGGEVPPDRGGGDEIWRRPEATGTSSSHGTHFTGERGFYSLEMGHIISPNKQT